MEKEEIFEAWAPYDGVWSPWVKPVLFAHLPRLLPELPPEAFPTPHAVPPRRGEGLAVAPDVGVSGFRDALPPPRERQALVVELPGPLAVTVGLDLAEAGYRPVPLFNACPPPWTEAGLAPAAVDVDMTLARIVRGAERLRALRLPAAAPPAFLTDEGRQSAQIEIRPGVFDNRSVLYTTDFPSAAFLLSQGIQGAVLVRLQGGPFAWDLVQCLHAWRRGGLRLSEWRLMDRDRAPEALTLPSSWFLADWWRYLWAGLSLRPNPRGGFGGVVESSGG